MDEEVLKTIKEKGLLLEKEVYDLVGQLKAGIAKELLESLEKSSGQKMLTKDVLSKNVGVVKNVVNKLEGEEHDVVENIIVKLGVSMEISKEREVVDKVGSDSAGVTRPPARNQETEDNEAERGELNYKIFSPDTMTDKKLEVGDFVGHFRARYSAMQRILMGRPEIQQDLVSLNKIGSERQNVSFIGIVTEKRVTKNKNLIIRFEDLTGEITALVKVDREEIFEKADELQLDDVVGVRASGNQEIVFIHDIFYPDAIKHEKMRFEEDYWVGFISDIHCGSNKHLSVEFKKFLTWINSDDEIAKKMKYLFIVGDTVDGVGIFPGQENLLDLKSMEEQYELLGSYLEKVPKHITMFMCAGQHDATRVAEPQPIVHKKYAGNLYDIENLILVSNPTNVKLLEGPRRDEPRGSSNSSEVGAEKEFDVLMYHGASIHSLINEIKELREMKAHVSPAKAVKHMLKRRHLAPSHGDVVYIPNAEKDPMVIENVPDVLCTGEVHRLDIENYNGVLIITGSCWQARTDFEEKVGNIPDPCKVPLLNLKTREVKILDFSSERGKDGD